MDSLSVVLSVVSRIRRTILGAARNIEDPALFRKLSLIPLLAWIGLGADGLSSSAYGPPEGYLTLGPHAYLALFLGLFTALTVFVISYSYSHIIEHFPSGGGGYIVATHTLGDKAGVVSGSALLVDYVLTIAVSITACSDALFSFVPPSLHGLRLPAAFALIIMLTVLNMRGVRESVTVLAPIFLVFIVSHALLLGLGILNHSTQFIPVMANIPADLGSDLASIGAIGILAVFLRAYSLGGGTYTGIEAVANGMQIMREPKVQTGKRTMAYMAASLAVVAGGLYLCYSLWQIQPVPGQTLNAVLAQTVFGTLSFGGWIALITILSEGALLIGAAQTGFIDGPRVMANMAIDSWMPRRFASLSERLTMANGILLMGGAALLVVLFTRGSITALITMYAINVFVTFTLSQLGMVLFSMKNRAVQAPWKKNLSIFSLGFLLCATILAVTVYEKIGEGGWLTMFITVSLIGVCYLIRGHYQKVVSGFKRFDTLLANVPSTGMANLAPADPIKKTAIQLVNGFNGFGVHTFLSIIRSFPNYYENFVFVSVAVIDSGIFKGAAEIKRLEESTARSLHEYVDLARSFGIAATYRMATATDVVDAGSALVRSTAAEFLDSTCFAGQIVFEHEHPFQKILHNETAFAIQRRLQFNGITTVIMPIQARL